MKAFSIDAQKREVKEIDIVMQANSVYSFFNSILIDDLTTLDKHMIHADAEAISNSKEAFFIGEQLIVGDALIIGKDGFDDIDASIPLSDLESLVKYEVPTFYKDALKLMQNSDINLYRVFEVSKKEEDISLNTEWVLYVFNIADDRTKKYFLDELKKAVEAEKDITEHMQQMAILALNAGAVK